MPDTQIHTAHLEPLFALNDSAANALMGMLGSHFVSHGELDRDTLVRFVAEAEAVSA